MFTDDTKTIADLIREIAMDVLDCLGEDADARFAFFRAFVELAKAVVDDNPARP
jgi:hypothetical protein